MTFDLWMIGLFWALCGLAEIINWIVEKRRDLEKARRRDYPERCRECHLYPESCTCTKRYRVRTGFNSPERIRLGRWN